MFSYEFKFKYFDGLETYMDQFNIDDSTPDWVFPAGSYQHSLGLVSTAGAVSLMTTHTKGWKFVDEVWKLTQVFQ